MTARNKQINKVDPEGSYQTLNNGDVTCEEWDLDTEFSFSVLCLLESLDLYNETALFSNKNLLFKLLPFYFDAISERLILNNIISAHGSNFALSQSILTISVR